MERDDPVKITNDTEKDITPPWLEPMLKIKFFHNCAIHLGLRRKECNFYCTDCLEKNRAICNCCKDEEHSDHHVIQIRKSSYHEVVRVTEVATKINVSGIHTYIINGSDVFFLNERPQPKGVGAAAGKNAASPYFCAVCCRSLLNNFMYCSIGCKMAWIKNGGNASFLLEEVKEKCDSNRIGNENGSMSKDSGEGEEGSSAAKDVKHPIPRLRARPRKGIPCRSPFF
ncbi:PLATZ transcription factor family protein [Rhynchospora pubera]|uniref:PLATZ transcription factor family protein n=1 Tax=Rhynchospora pubera TaxID=906938 RepID=A0AAV8F391_9POAL|nr:PLATZ transcription factor family protein [Rhynchospora pubera]